VPILRDLKVIVQYASVAHENVEAIVLFLERRGERGDGRKVSHVHEQELSLEARCSLDFCETTSARVFRCSGPIRAKCFAASKPSPVLAPVTTTVRLERSTRSIVGSFIHCERTNPRKVNLPMVESIRMCRGRSEMASQ
jgi:hypothetical protein